MRRGSQRGQATLEHLGLMLLVALALAAAAGASQNAVRGVPQTLARAIVPAASAGSTFHRREREPPVAVAERLQRMPLAEFLAYRSSRERDPRLDYTTDECTAPLVGNAGATYDFTHACMRHDFGYRNFGPLGLLDERRDAVDRLFLDDMRDHCLARRRQDLIPCLSWARTYHRAVRAFGWIAARG